MTAPHANLLRQIRDDARPYVEQWLDLTEVFSGFQKLASENGLDWGLIKGLLKAEATDERKGDGAKRVDKIIAKADAAGEYAVLLGLAPEKMNEFKYSAEVIQDEVGREALPPHDEDGVIIDDVPANGPATAPAPGAGGMSAKGDAGESMDLTVHCLNGASPAISPASAPYDAEVGQEGGPERPAGDELGVPSSSVAPHTAPVPPKTEAEAPGEMLALPSSMPGAPIPCEANGWAGLEPPPMFDRRRPAA